VSDLPASPLPAAVDPLIAAYNDVAYVGTPNGASHPDHLACVATLLGLDAASVATCRVLELGCGDGANLVPMAATLPRATFVGCDFAQRPIDRARRMAADLGLTNVTLFCADVRELPADLGTFDFVIAHGLYSWIPSEVRAHVLPLIARHLAPNGVAFVSYNTYPGCHVRQAAWEMLKYHVRDIPDVKQKLPAVRGLIELLCDPARPQHPNDEALRAELVNMARLSDSALCHDDLSEPNIPVYFHEFQADATRSGLTFLAEAELHVMMASSATPRVRQALGQMDRLTREQYVDFVVFRRYRQSLLCHAQALSQFVMRPPRAAAMHAYAAPALRRASAADVASVAQHVDVRAVKEAVLARWPACVSVAELARAHAARAAVGGAQGNAGKPLETLIVELWVSGLIGLRLDPPAVAVAVSERPVAFGPARWIGREFNHVPNLYHEGIELQDATGRALLQLLDGRHTRAELIAAIGGPYARPDGPAQLEQGLERLARLALLVG
jgi:SAM-dependent methyltransferase